MISTAETFLLPACVGQLLLTSAFFGATRAPATVPMLWFGHDTVVSLVDIGVTHVTNNEELPDVITFHKFGFAKLAESVPAERSASESHLDSPYFSKR
jgi:hypothetical protein